MLLHCSAAGLLQQHGAALQLCRHFRLFKLLFVVAVRYKGKFEFTYVSTTAVIVKTLATGSRTVLKSGEHIDICGWLLLGCTVLAGCLLRWAVRVASGDVSVLGSCCTCQDCSLIALATPDPPHLAPWPVNLPCSVWLHYRQGQCVSRALRCGPHTSHAAAWGP